MIALKQRGQHRPASSRRVAQTGVQGQALASSRWSERPWRPTLTGLPPENMARERAAFFARGLRLGGVIEGDRFGVRRVSLSA